MAAPLNWNAKHVKHSVSGELVAENVTAVVTQNTLTLITRDSQRTSKEGVSAVTVVRGAPNTRLVTFDDGTEYLVTRKSGCGCR